jgi:hypothetical protein
MLACCLVISFVAFVAALTAVGQLAIWDHAFGGSWRVQLVRMLWYSCALTFVGFFALVLHFVARSTVGQLISVLLERWHRRQRSRQFRPYSTAIRNPAHRHVTDTIYRVGGAAGLHQALDAIRYPRPIRVPAVCCGLDSGRGAAVGSRTACSTSGFRVGRKALIPCLMSCFTPSSPRDSWSSAMKPGTLTRSFLPS